jgi:hypothetical protein
MNEYEEDDMSGYEKELIQVAAVAVAAVMCARYGSTKIAQDKPGKSPSNLMRVLHEVFLERRRQEAKWGEQKHGPAGWAAILGEEVGEVIDGVLVMPGHLSQMKAALSPAFDLISFVGADCKAWIDKGGLSNHE